MSEIKAHRLFPELYDISDFLANQSHPTNKHPSDPSYIKHYSYIERCSIEGLWGYDGNRKKQLGGYRYMTPQMHHFITCNNILREDPKNPARKKPTYPDLYDTTWIMGYGWLAAKCYSGFSEDKEYSCFRPLLKMEMGIELDEIEKVLFDIAHPHIIKKNGKYKKYVDAIDYLYTTHPEPMGLPLYDNEAKDYMIYGTRGFGKSYFMSGCIDHSWRYHGVREWTEDWITRAVPQVVFVASTVESKIRALITKFEENNRFIENELGSYKDRYERIPGALFQKSRGQFEPNTENPLTYLFDYREDGNKNNPWVEVGTGTQILAQVYARGKIGLTAAVSLRADELYHDEIGLTEYLEAILGANENVKTRSFRTGSEFLGGTSGVISAALANQNIFTKPDSHNIISYPDPDSEGLGRIAGFVPATMAKSIYKDPLGNTIYDKALRAELQYRKRLLEEGAIERHTDYVMNNPLVWGEMFLESGNMLLPSEQARKRLSVLTTTKENIKYGRAGEFEYTDDTKKDVKFVTKPEKKYTPILSIDFTKLKGNYSGDCMLYEPPLADIPKRSYSNAMYKITYDPLKDDGKEATTSKDVSLAAIIVWKGIQGMLFDKRRSNTIVFTYYGRRDHVEEIHEIAYQAGLFFNATILYEVNVGSVKTWFVTMKVYHMLQPCPLAAMKQLLKNPTGKYKVGVHMSIELIIESEPLLKSLLLTALYSEGDETIRVIDEFLCTFALESIQYYKRDRNLDAIRCLMMLAVWKLQEIQQPNQSYDPEKRKKNYTESMVKSLNHENVQQQYYDQLFG